MAALPKPNLPSRKVRVVIDFLRQEFGQSAI